jgi:hypothetical protein
MRRDRRAYRVADLGAETGLTTVVKWMHPASVPRLRAIDGSNRGLKKTLIRP